MVSEMINFVIPSDRTWPEIKAGRENAITDEMLSQRALDALSNWIIIPYIYFRRAGHPVTYSGSPVRDRINIASGLDLGIRARTVDAFIVACRADGHLPMLANHVFEQNGLNARRRHVSWVHHPPQPGLMPRLPGRARKMQVVAFKGSLGNLDERFRNQAFQDRLSELGLTLRIDGGDMGDVRMHDYRDVDAVLAIRNLTQRDSLVKPASKLINAWRGNVPAILGPEYAFRELRRSDLDYFEAEQPEEVIRNLSYLMDNPKHYEAMAENGRRRAADFSEQALVQSWTGILGGVPGADFAKWSRSGQFHRRLFFYYSAVGEKLSKTVSWYHRYYGKRLL